MSTSTQRRIRPPFQGQKGLCSWCGTDQIPARRRTWCSQACVNAYRQRSDPEWVRRQLWKRDKGICALCGVDAVKAFQEWCGVRREICQLASRLVSLHRQQLDWDPYRGWVWRWEPAVYQHASWSEQQAFLKDLLTRYGPPGNWTAGRQTGWDADHIVPVSEGGADLGLENYRTLCHGCHKKVTAELKKKKKEKR